MFESIHVISKDGALVDEYVNMQRRVSYNKIECPNFPPPALVRVVALAENKEILLATLCHFFTSRKTNSKHHHVMPPQPSSSWFTRDTFLDIEARTRSSLSSWMNPSTPQSSAQQPQNPLGSYFHDFSDAFHLTKTQRLMGLILSLLASLVLLGLAIASLSALRISQFLFFFSVSNMLMMGAPFWMNQSINWKSMIKSMGFWVYLGGMMAVFLVVAKGKGMVLLFFAVSIQVVGAFWWITEKVPQLRTLVYQIYSMVSWMLRWVF